jgi:hypothetical protein
MQKLKANIGSELTQRLMQLLNDLEYLDRDRMSNDGKSIMDDIWKHLGQPTFEENEKIKSGNKK